MGKCLWDESKTDKLLRINQGNHQIGIGFWLSEVIFACLYNGLKILVKINMDLANQPRGTMNAPVGLHIIGASALIVAVAWKVRVESIFGGRSECLQPVRIIKTSD